jgi:MAP/microtubule affinity-regulating kinase
MEYYPNGDLMDHVHPRKHLKEKECRRIFKQLMSAVKYLHSLNICHRDLKHQNIVLDKNKNIKLIDFGFSTEYKKGEQLDTFCG